MLFFPHSEDKTGALISLPLLILAPAPVYVLLSHFHRKNAPSLFFPCTRVIHFLLAVFQVVIFSGWICLRVGIHWSTFVTIWDHDNFFLKISAVLIVVNTLRDGQQVRHNLVIFLAGLSNSRKSFLPGRESARKSCASSGQNCPARTQYRS